MNQLIKFWLKHTIYHEDLIVEWKWLIHTLQFLLHSLLYFSLKIIDYTLLTLYSEKWILFRFFEKTLHQKTKMPISYGFCWVWHIWVILHMRGKPNPTSSTKWMQEFRQSPLIQIKLDKDEGNDLMLVPCKSKTRRLCLDLKKN